MKVEIITTRAPRGKGQLKKVAQNEAWIHTGQYWWGRMVPKHFEPGAVMAYGYEQRSKKYMIRKGQKKGHQKPLVWSGETMRRMVGQRPPIRILKKGGELDMRWKGMPRYLFITSSVVRTPEGNTVTVQRPNMREELTRVTTREREELAKQFGRRFARVMERG